MLSRFNRTPGSVIYGNRTRKVMVPKLTGMALEGAALELDIGNAIVPDHDHPSGDVAGHAPHNCLSESISGGYRAHGVPGDIYGWNIWRLLLATTTDDNWLC